ncbi:MAG: F0F1 ATP synthase subunit A [Dehalococcoidales bacterium]|nr:F0F1 ATP synthase subunit A [Dehalococcoidales bacterium]
MRKRGCLGCSFPLLIILIVVVLALTILGFINGAIGIKYFENIGISWLQVPDPEPHLPPGHLFHLGDFIITNTMFTAWISIIIIILLSFFAFRRPKMVPSGLQSVMEFVFGSLLDFCQSVAGEKNGRRFFPVVATIFIFVLVNAWISLLPFYGDAIYRMVDGEHVTFFRGANTDLNLTLAIAIFSVVCIEFFGFKTLGIRYLGEFIRIGQLKNGLGKLFSGKMKSAFGAIFFGAIDLAVGLLEFLSHIIRIVSFSFRLFGNMMAGEIMLLVTAFLIPMIFAIPFYGLECLFSFVQALIFGGLTLVFMTVAVSSHEEEHS